MRQLYKNLLNNKSMKPGIKGEQLRKEFERKRNFRQRLEFVHFWAAYVKRTPNAVWSKQHTEFINAVLRNANQDREVYMRIREKMEGKRNK